MLASKPSQQVESDSRSFENPLDSVKADRALMSRSDLTMAASNIEIDLTLWMALVHRCAIT